MTSKNLLVEEKEVLYWLENYLTDLNLLREPFSDLRLREYLNCLDQLVVMNNQRASGSFDKKNRYARSNLFGYSSSIRRSELSFNFYIDRNFDDHNLNNFVSGFVLNWTHQREEITPLTGGEASRDEV